MPSTRPNGSVRLRGAKQFVTDGPFAETREQLGGSFLIDAKDLDGATGIAAWRIVHEHTSVPFYMDGSLRPAFDLKP